MAAVNQVKGTEFEFCSISNFVENINEGYCLLSQPMRAISRSANECISGRGVTLVMNTIKLLQTCLTHDHA